MIEMEMKTFSSNWSGTGVLSPACMINAVLSPMEELSVFERGLKDRKNPLTADHLHLFPSLREDGCFMTMDVSQAHDVLKAAASPPLQALALKIA